MSCPYGTFRLENSDVFFLHLWESLRKPARGWTGDDIMQEDEEQCHVTNVDDQALVVRDLWRFVRSDDDQDDGFGPVKEKRKIVEKVGMCFRCSRFPEYENHLFYTQETMKFRLLMKMSGEACSSKTLNCAPIIHYEKRKSLTTVLKNLKFVFAGSGAPALHLFFHVPFF